MKVPWQWSLDDLQSWVRHLNDGLDSSAALVDLFSALALVIGWICAGVLIYTVIVEAAFQVRHGMPSAHQRRLGGLGLLGRKLATVLVAVLPLAISATPALAGPSIARAAVGVVVERAPDLVDPGAASVTMPTVASTLGGGWSLVEVKRGDSVWAIAERFAAGRDTALVAGQIVSANLGTVMGDGHRFSTPALIEPGLDVERAGRRRPGPCRRGRRDPAGSGGSCRQLCRGRRRLVLGDCRGPPRFVGEAERSVRIDHRFDAHQRSTARLLRSASDSPGGRRPVRGRRFRGGSRRDAGTDGRCRRTGCRCTGRVPSRVRRFAAAGPSRHSDTGRSAVARCCTGGGCAPVIAIRRLRSPQRRPSTPSPGSSSINGRQTPYR